MTINRRTFISLAASSALLPYAHAQVSDLNDAINKAGRQRMLSQRMAKAYLSLGQKVQTATATKVLASSMALFDRQLAELKAYAPNGTVRGTYDQLEAEWSVYKALLVGAAPSATAAAKLLTQDTKVLGLAHMGTGQLEQLSNKPTGKLVNIAGRQRMLSQRMAKYYLAMAWNVDNAASEFEMNKASKEFIVALEVLRTAPEATPEIKQELSLADNQWVFFDAALRARPSASAKNTSDVFQASENLLQVMDKVTGLYARVGKG
jgi:nitrate/nitrite-specific signal transduction histidine kinase